MSCQTSRPGRRDRPVRADKGARAQGHPPSADLAGPARRPWAGPRLAGWFAVARVCIPYHSLKAPSQQPAARWDGPARNRGQGASDASAHLLTWRPDLGGLVRRRGGRRGAKPPDPPRALHHGGAPLPAIGGATRSAVCPKEKTAPRLDRRGHHGPARQQRFAHPRDRARNPCSTPHTMALGAVRRAVLAARPAVQARWLALHAVKVPSLGDSVPNGSILTLTKSPGDQVAVDDVLLVIETDKVREQVCVTAGRPRERRATARPREPSWPATGGIGHLRPRRETAPVGLASARLARWTASNPARTSHRQRALVRAGRQRPKATLAP